MSSIRSSYIPIQNIITHKENLVSKKILQNNIFFVSLFGETRISLSTKRPHKEFLICTPLTYAHPDRKSYFTRLPRTYFKEAFASATSEEIKKSLCRRILWHYRNQIIQSLRSMTFILCKTKVSPKA